MRTSNKQIYFQKKEWNRKVFFLYIFTIYSNIKKWKCHTIPERYSRRMPRLYPPGRSSVQTLLQRVEGCGRQHQHPAQFPLHPGLVVHLTQPLPCPRVQPHAAPVQQPDQPLHLHLADRQQVGVPLVPEEFMIIFIINVTRYWVTS